MGLAEAVSACANLQEAPHLEPLREKVEFGEAFVIVSPALLLRRRADVES